MCRKYGGDDRQHKSADEIALSVRVMGNTTFVILDERRK